MAWTVSGGTIGRALRSSTPVALVAYNVGVAIPVYRTESGLIMRVIEADDGGLKVETLQDGSWVAGRIGMVGLRLSRTTDELTAEEAKALPD
jgi:hypothetical protein